MRLPLKGMNLMKKLRGYVLRSFPESPKVLNFQNKRSLTLSSFYRDPLVKAWLLNNSNGVCEGCRYPAPFLTMSGDPYLEVHHIKPLSKGGSDTIFNTVTLCPNCHRRCHNSCDRANFSILLSQSMSRPANCS